MIAYKIHKAVALALRWVAEQSDFNADTFAAIAKRSAHAKLDKEAQKAAAAVGAAVEKRVRVQAALDRVFSEEDDAIVEYADLLAWHSDQRHDIDIEAI